MIWHQSMPPTAPRSWPMRNGESHGFAPRATDDAREAGEGMGNLRQRRMAERRRVRQDASAA